MSAAVLIIARAPRAGQAKTRLQPMLGPRGCAHLQIELIRHTVGWAARTGFPTWLAHTPAGARAELQDLIPHGVELFPQVSGDLGARLRAATRRIGAGHKGPLIVVGTDAPLLGDAQAHAALQTLAAGHDACLVPALDGGYVMIALARPCTEPFMIAAGAWGGPQVLELTLRACGRAGLSVVALDPVPDLDTPGDAAGLQGDPCCPEGVRAALILRRAAA